MQRQSAHEHCICCSHCSLPVAAGESMFTGARFWGESALSVRAMYKAVKTPFYRELSRLQLYNVQVSNEKLDRALYTVLAEYFRNRHVVGAEWKPEVARTSKLDRFKGLFYHPEWEVSSPLEQEF